MNSLMLPMFTSLTFSIGTTRFLMQNFYRESQALIALLPKFLTEQRQGSALPKAAAQCRARELSRRGRRPWLAAAKRAERNRHVVRLAPRAHLRKSSSTQSGNNKAR